MIKFTLSLLLLVLMASADVIKNNASVTITIKGVPAEDASDLNGPYSVYNNGTINLPYLKNVKASGKTPSQLASSIESMYKNQKIYSNPTVNVVYAASVENDSKMITFITEHGSRNVPYMKGMSLQTAIAAAGGPQTFDSKRYAILERNQKTYNYDLQQMKHRNEKIYPNDVIRLPHVNSGIFSKLKGIFSKN